MAALTFARAVQAQQLARQGAALAMLVALAKSGLDLAAVGNFEALRYVGYVVTVFWVGSLSTAYLRARQTSPFPQRWFTFYLLAAALGGLATFAVFAFALPTVTGVLLDLPEVVFGLSFGVYLLGVLVGTVVEQEAIADRAAGRLAAYALTSYGLQVALFAGPLLWGAPLYVAMLGLAASAVYRLAWVTVRYLRTTDVQPPPRGEVRAFARSTANLSAYALGGVGVIMIDHALVSYGSADPASAIAIWRYGAQELPLLVGVIAGLNATALAEMSRDRADALDGIRRRGRRTATAFFAVAIVLAATSAQWWPWLLAESFAPAQVLFNTMLLLVPSRLVVTTPQLVSLDMEGAMARTGVAENVLNVVVSLALLPLLGLLGIAVGTVVAYSFERLVYVLLLWRRGLRPGSYLSTSTWFTGTALLLVAYAWGTDFTQLLGSR